MSTTDSRRALAAKLPELDGRRVLVVGDFFVDEYIEGEMFEISKEGPIPVVRFESRTRAAGAAGNLASSIRNLGAEVHVVGVRGDDPSGDALQAELEEKGIDTSGLLVDPGHPTWTYTKLRARVENAPSREILRLDVLPREPAGDDLLRRVIAACERLARGVDGIIVLDQVRHLVTPALLGALPDIAHRAGARLHGSSREHIADFRGFDLIIPNDAEACAALDRTPGPGLDVERLGRDVRELGRHRELIITLGPEGMVCFPEEGEPIRVPTFATEVVDVTGAGDAVASTVLVAMCAGWPLVEAALAASHAAAVALARVGTHHVTQRELAAALAAGVR